MRRITRFDASADKGSTQHDVEEHKLHHPLQVGGMCRIRLGPYEGISIKGRTMTVRYSDRKVLRDRSVSLSRRGSR